MTNYYLIAFSIPSITDGNPSSIFLLNDAVNEVNRTELKLQQSLRSGLIAYFAKIFEFVFPTFFFADLMFTRSKIPY
ncbi:MAG: hypothetical protein ACR2F1_05620 [Nitrososphaeraceae archaeon]